ncbi:PH, RCC1 and FYVE domains-containing protein 1-like [Camellia sinensis]|uniref:PH, RCC1 and FYVE domains-containing protein 1-like n=1 Tax=Camellia sinensis TaxID=4442 RepID=UPI0010356C18|nr:PH, RCC1 and FYVE domains-containing protein 1-like [Camellia sinensis]
MESFKRVESRSSKKNKKPEFNSSRVSPIPNGNSQWGDFNVSKSFNPMFGSSKKFFSASVLGSRIVSWATSLISRRSSPPRSTTPTPTLGGLTSLKIVVDDAKRIYDSLSQEVTRLRQQVENLTLKAQLQEVELETVKEVIKSLTAGNRSSGQSRQGQSKTTTRNGGRTKEGDSRNDNEWVVQDKPGVYITHTSLPGGVIDLKRVRFSRRRFSETQAEQWWAENRARVYKQYNVCEVDKSSVGVGSEDCGH